MLQPWVKQNGLSFIFSLLCRLNEAPVKGYRKDVGTKTTLRITYPEGAMQRPENYEKDSLFVFSAFKPLDFKWLRQIVFQEKPVRINSFEINIQEVLTQEWTQQKWLFKARPSFK